MYETLRSCVTVDHDPLTGWTCPVANRDRSVFPVTSIKRAKKKTRISSQSGEMTSLFIQQGIALPRLRPYSLMMMPSCQRKMLSRHIFQSGLVTPASAGALGKHSTSVLTATKKHHRTSNNQKIQMQKKRMNHCDNDRIRTCAAEAI